MSRRFEKPQTGNPHQLTIKQHVWPAASIARFTNQRGTVCLLQKTNNITRWAKPGDDIFCAHRIWDQRAEAGYMRQIEDAFQKLAARVAVGKVMKFDASEKAKIDYFFSLWCMRSSYKNAVGEDVHLNAVTGHD